MFRTSSILVAGFGLLASACFSAEFDDGTIACGEAGCPDGMSCHTDGFCYRDPPDDGVDPDPPPVPTSSTNVGLAVANSDAPDRIYAACDRYLVAFWNTPDSRLSTSVSWGDIDRDGDPEVAYGAYGAQTITYDVEDAVSMRWESPLVRNTRDVALFDINGDTDADLILGNENQVLRVFQWISDDESYQERWVSEAMYATSSIDIDFDDARHNDYNLAVGAMNAPDVVIHFDEDGSIFEVWSTPEWDDTRDVAWGDYDNDSRPDLATANWNQPNRVYRRSNFGEYTLIWSTPENDKSTSIAWADFDLDGDPDLAVGNWNAPNRLYRNNGDHFSLSWSSNEADKTSSVAWGDFDLDGDPDLAVGNEREPNRVYRNDGGAWELVWSSAESDFTTGIAWATWDVADDELGMCRMAEAR